MMRAYLLCDSGRDGQLYLSFGVGAVEAAEAVIRRIGGSLDVNRFSVGGSYPCDPNEPINVSQWWPYFTCNPGRHSPSKPVSG